eukprot:2934506-Prymnesium_polylepis.1
MSFFALSSSIVDTSMPSSIGSCSPRKWMASRRQLPAVPSSTSKRRWRGGSWCFWKLDATPLA